MDIFKKFVDNNRIFGYKGKLPLIRDMIDEHSSKQFENLFYSLNILYDEINMLDSQKKDNDIFKGKKKFTSLTQSELQIYQKYFVDKDSNISEFNENPQLLDLALDDINNDNYLLDLEIEKMEEEIALNEQLLSNEVTDNDLLKKKKKSINNNNSEFFEHKIANYKKDNIDAIKQDTIMLNKTLNNIGTELDLNIKKSALLKDNQSYIVGHRKINDTQFDEATKLLIDVIYQFEYNYDKIQRKIKNEKEENNNININNDIFGVYMKDINKTEEQMKKVMMADIELSKNNFLYFIHKSKIIYENNLLKEYLENPFCLNDYYKKYIESNKKNKNDVNMSSSAITVNLSKKIKQVFNIEENNLHNKYIQIKNIYFQKILDKYLSLKFQDQISFIENMEKYEKILNSIYPYLIDDEKVTQLIYDSICDVTEIYSVFQSKIGVKQNFLRQKYSKIVEPINKITIDERDNVLLNLAREYFGENEDEEGYNKYNNNKNNNRINVQGLIPSNNNYHIYEIKKIIDKLIYLFKNVKSNELNEIIDKMYSDVTCHFKDIIPFVKVFLNNQNNLVEVKKLNKKFKEFQDITKYLIYDFNENIDKIILKKDIMSKSNLAVLSIYDILFLYFFQRDVYNREFGINNFIFNNNLKIK